MPKFELCVFEKTCREMLDIVFTLKVEDIYLPIVVCVPNVSSRTEAKHFSVKHIL